MRKRLLESFRENEAQAMAALARRWANPKYVQDMVELLARLGGEMDRDAAEGKGISLLILNNQGDQPLDPVTFRAALDRRVLEERAAQGDAGSTELAESHELESQHLPRIPPAEFGLEDFLDPSDGRRQSRAPNYARRRPAASAARRT